MPETHRVTIRLSDTLLAALATRLRPGETLSDTIRRAVAQYIAESQPTVSGVSLGALVDEMREGIAQILSALSDRRRPDNCPPSTPRLTPPRRLPGAASDSLERPLPATRALGKLCPQGHEYEHTGQSLLRLPSKGCVVCHRESTRRSMQRARAQA
jgi:hypothetical protein